MVGRSIAKTPRQAPRGQPGVSTLEIFVGVVGIEAVSAAPKVPEDPLVTDGEPGSEQDARGHERTQVVASLATALADAVPSGDHERARALAEELRELEAQRASPPQRRAGSRAT